MLPLLRDGDGTGPVPAVSAAIFTATRLRRAERPQRGDSNINSTINVMAGATGQERGPIVAPVIAGAGETRAGPPAGGCGACAPRTASRTAP